MKNNQSGIRQQKRLERRQLSDVERASKSQIIAKQLLTTDAYQQSSRIACYLSLDEEVNLQPLIEQAWQDNKSVYLPVVTARDLPLSFAIYHADGDMTTDKMGISVPNIAAEQYIDPAKLDMVIMPLVAFDDDCHRIGMGGGFYDRTFAFRKKQSHPILIGVAFDLQRASQSIICHDWDVMPDVIISESARYKSTNQ